MLAPVLAGGIAVIGDPAVYASAGDTRLAASPSTATASCVTVLGANERVRIVGWSEHPLSASSWSPGARERRPRLRTRSVLGTWDVELDVGPAGWAKLHLRAPDGASTYSGVAPYDS